jgi:hypothetical protein
MKINLGSEEISDAVRFWLESKVANFGEYIITDIDVPSKYSAFKEVEVTLERKLVPIDPRDILAAKPCPVATADDVADAPAKIAVAQSMLEHIDHE